ncbi:unnamed protein product, partial [Effrenium voratum]
SGKLRLSAVSYGACINACGRAREWQRCLLLLDQLEASLLEISAVEFSGALSACEGQKGLEVFQRMCRRGVELDAVAFNGALKACEGRWRQALALLEEMQERQLFPTLVSFSSAISCCEKAHEDDKALQLLDAMRQAGHQPNEICFSAAMSACEKEASSGSWLFGCWGPWPKAAAGWTWSRWALLWRRWGWASAGATPCSSRRARPLGAWLRTGSVGTRCSHPARSRCSGSGRCAWRSPGTRMW